jgi:hypothetical protein
MRKIDPSIPLVCLCGNHGAEPAPSSCLTASVQRLPPHARGTRIERTDVGNTPTRATIYSYKERFGDDYFRFWVGGVRPCGCSVSVDQACSHDSAEP